MQLKWMEDFLTLAETASFSRAAEIRNVTHPAFGRRIQSLEEWAGTPLVERGKTPVKLTPAGKVFLESAQQLVRGIESSRIEMMGEAGRQERTVTIATGRTLARTVLADMLVRMHPATRKAQIRIATGSIQDSVHMFERNDADFMLGYHHPVLTVRLDGRQFLYANIASDKLVPVSRTDAKGAPMHAVSADTPVPLLAYGHSLALGRLVEDYLTNNKRIPHIERRIECDSADALREYVLKGLGVAWLPWSMVQGDCKSGRMAHAGDRQMEVKFEVRLYRPKRRLHELAESVWNAVVSR